MKKTVVTALALMTVACSETTKTQFSYIDVVTNLEMPDGNYRIREHPSRDRLMVTPSWGRMVSGGLARSWTLGMVDTLPGEIPIIAAAAHHMDNTGRSHCRPISARPLMEPHYEVVFNCSQLLSEAN